VRRPSGVHRKDEEAGEESLSMKNPPSFQFYPQDFLSDLNVRSMSHAEVGMYIKLLCHCWIEDGLPTNGSSRVVDLYFKKSPTVARCFVEIDGKYRNSRLDLEREKQRQWREKCSKGGLHSAENKRVVKGSSRVVQVKANSSSSSSSSIKNHKNDSINIVEAWNSTNIRNLKEGESKIREKTVSKIESVLKEYPLAVVIKAIENYSTVVHNPELYFFSYKWELCEFLQRGLRKFMDEAQPFENFKIKNSAGPGRHEPDSPRVGANTAGIHDEKYWAEVRRLRAEGKEGQALTDALAEKVKEGKS